MKKNRLNNLLSYPDFNKRFEIHTNSSDLKIEEVIIQEVKLIDLYSRKLTVPQNGIRR